MSNEKTIMPSEQEKQAAVKHKGKTAKEWAELYVALAEHYVAKLKNDCNKADETRAKGVYYE